MWRSKAFQWLAGFGVSVLALCIAAWAAWEAHRANEKASPAPVVQLVYPTPPLEPSSTGCWDSADVAPQTGGWWPQRPTYQSGSAPAFNSFNVVRDQTEIGDERAFVGIKDAANQNAGGWSSHVEMKPGHTYLLRLTVHNAAPKTQVATGVTAQVALPTCAGHAIQIGGWVKSGDSFPDSVNATAMIWSRNTFNIAFDADSARYYTTKSPPGGFHIVGETALLAGSGALLGVDRLDGRIPGSPADVGYLTLKFHPQFAE